MNKKVILGSVTALALTLGLAGCTNEANAPAETKPAVKESAKADTPEPTADADNDEETAPVDGVAAPGTTVKVGETATVSWGPLSDSPLQPVDITVTSITQGTIDDFAVAGADFQAKLEGLNTYYITVEAKKGDANGEALASASLYSDMGAVDADGKRMQTVSMIGDFAPCNTSSLDKGIDEGGTSTFCYIVAGDSAGDIGGATFKPYDGDYSEEPVTWTK